MPGLVLHGRSCADAQAAVATPCALAEEAIAHLHEVTDKLAELSALPGDDEGGEGTPWAR